MRQSRLINQNNSKAPFPINELKANASEQISLCADGGQSTLSKRERDYHRDI